MNIRAVIWDLGGVLVRTEDYTSRDRLAARLGLSREELEDLVFSNDSGDRAQLGLISVEQHLENLRQRFGLQRSEMDHFWKEFWGGDRLDAELVAFIRSLRARYRTGLLSNAFSDLRHYVTHVWKFADAFDEMVISAEVGLVKPDARIYRLILERLGVAPQEAVFIDDMPRNVEGARAVNLHAVQFVTPQQARGELERLLNGGVG
jgi:epoxide hydrolase-like predicted phosphatase